ncbi:hypothetical protein C8J57DRAFT_1667783 [Mycena rebaudengoi]|nr:hypothetical protein C8J57DRAFT_1568985 [Mycena rebaudengoi]KAJ7250257.1 hypothetical protein C8J57DRAFT_1667783 [Mycena rebaudengoi]
MFSKSLIFFASIAAASALAVGPTPDVGTTVTLCTDPNGVSGCLNIPVNSDTCRSLTGGFSFLNDGVSTAKIPAGFICTFFDAVGCVSNTDTDVVFLQGGSWNLNAVPGIAGTVNFNDKTSSFTCSTF